MMTNEQIERLGVLVYDMVVWSECGRGEYPPNALRDYVQTLLTSERAAAVAECAEICDEFARTTSPVRGVQLAAAIRKLGEKRE